MSSNKDIFYNQPCFDNDKGASFFDLIEKSGDATIPFFRAIEEVEQLDEEKQHYDWINSQIDLRYQNGEFKETPLHAALSHHKYYHAGEAIYHFFTDDTINQISIGSSSSDMRNHTIFKCRERKMVFEVHCAYGEYDIFPLRGISEYLEEYSVALMLKEEWINLSYNLPNYDMVPLSKY